MSRAEAKRPWVKLHIIPCLGGSIRYQLTPAQRSVWYDLILLAGIQPEPGIIADSDKRPYPHSFIANRLNIPVKLLRETLALCIEEGRIVEDEQGIHIVNWKVYQSEYQRQKFYRDKKNGPARGDGMVGWIKVAGEDVSVQQARNGDTYYRDKSRQVIYVTLNPKTEKYEPSKE